MNIDAIRDAFLRFLAEGKTHLEAYREFDRDEFQSAMKSEIDSGEIVYSGFPDFRLLTPDGKPALFELCARAHSQERNERDLENEAYALWMAGWTSHPVTSNSQVMSWYWRRPPRRPGKPGRLFLSTSQAFNAMVKERKVK